MKMPNAEKALQYYYNYTEIGNAEIKQLFSCGDSTAIKLKKQAQKEMSKNTTKTWNPKSVDTICAYRAWGIDVKRLEEMVTKQKKLQSKGILT